MGRQLTIKIKPGQDVNRAILKLKSLAINEGIFKEAKDRKYFVPAGIKISALKKIFQLLTETPGHYFTGSQAELSISMKKS